MSRTHREALRVPSVRHVGVDNVSYGPNVLSTAASLRFGGQYHAQVDVTRVMTLYN